MPYVIFHVHVHNMLLNLIDIFYQIVLHHLNQDMPTLKTVTIKKLEHYNIWIILKFLDNKTPQIELDNIHTFILAEMSTNKAELVEVNGYAYIAANDESENNFYIVRFASVMYMIQEYVESDGNKSAEINHVSMSSHVK